MCLLLTSTGSATFSGRNGAGVVTITGAQVGDLVLGVFCSTNNTLQSAQFESIISVADEIQQTGATNFTGEAFTVVLARP